jgi:hypothetical protein
MLPSLSKSLIYEEILLPESKVAIKIRPFVLKDEKHLLLKIGDRKNQTLVFKAIKEFIQACISEEDIETFKKISTVDFTFILMKLRQATKGDTINLKHVCEECKFPNEVAMSIENHIKVTLPEKNEISLMDGKIILKMKTMSLEEELAGIDKKQVDTTEAKLNLVYDKLYSSISEIIYDGEVYNSFTKEEVAKFLDELPGTENQKLLKATATLVPNIKLFGTFKCFNPQCQKEFSLTMEGLKSFFI